MDIQETIRKFGRTYNLFDLECRVCGQVWQFHNGITCPVTVTKLPVPYTLPDPRNNGETLALVMVEWVDAMGDANWQTHYEATKQGLCRCTNVGFILYSDEERVVIGSQFDHEHEKWAEVTTIPKTWQVKITPLGVVESCGTER